MTRCRASGTDRLANRRGDGGGTAQDPRYLTADCWECDATDVPLCTVLHPTISDWTVQVLEEHEPVRSKP